MTSKKDSPEILVVAAEASSSLYAQRLIEEFDSKGIDVHMFGVGSQAMEKNGFEILGRSEEMAVVGLQEVLAHYSHIKGVFNRLVEEAEKRKPKMALLLDYPDFNLRLAKKLKKLGIPVVYYISPQVWAWRQSRVKTIQQLVDKMLVLFPFEKEFYEQHGVNVDFVGHPLLDELNGKFFDPEYLKLHRQKCGVRDDEFLLGLMPGSRTSEINHHLETQLATAEKLCAEMPSLKVALFVAPSFDLEEFKAGLPKVNFPLMVIQDDPLEMIHLSDIVLCASGTATLLTGLMEKPMVIMYRMNPMTAWLAKRFVSQKHFGMINLILGKEVAPEFFQEDASANKLSSCISSYLNDPSKRTTAIEELKRAKIALGDSGATGRVLQALTPYLESRR